VPFRKEKIKKSASQVPTLYKPDHDVSPYLLYNNHNNIPNVNWYVQSSLNKPIMQPDVNVFKRMSSNVHEEYKIPVLYRSKRGGIRYRLSEILFPRDPKVRRANLRFNQEHMKNKLLSIGDQASKDIKRKLIESLKTRNDNLLKHVKESSMRMLMTDLLYLKSDLSKLP
jgi:hypothetical protein